MDRSLTDVEINALGLLRDEAASALSAAALATASVISQPR